MTTHEQSVTGSIDPGKQKVLETSMNIFVDAVFDSAKNENRITIGGTPGVQFPLFVKVKHSEDGHACMCVVSIEKGTAMDGRNPDRPPTRQTFFQESVIEVPPISRPLPLKHVVVVDTDYRLLAVADVRLL